MHGRKSGAFLLSPLVLHADVSTSPKLTSPQHNVHYLLLFSRHASVVSEQPAALAAAFPPARLPALSLASCRAHLRFSRIHTPQRTNKGLTYALVQEPMHRARHDGTTPPKLRTERSSPSYETQLLPLLQLPRHSKLEPLGSHQFIAAFVLER
ncbi:hypothetical protein TRVL_06977 [Trypanosoma vivax]|nr:hypothetical protein TRVL_06977 [Trypanosoma vivax]